MDPRLVSFPESEASQATTRDFALALETLAQRNIEGASHEAERYLRKAVKERPDDPVLLSALGFIDQKHGREKEARELYERVLKIDPLSNDTATNLGTLEARSGNLRRAVELWQGAFERVPNRSAIGMDLLCASEFRSASVQALKRINESFLSVFSGPASSAPSRAGYWRNRVILSSRSLTGVVSVIEDFPNEIATCVNCVLPLTLTKKPQQLRGLNRNHNHDLKAIFGTGAVPFHDFY